MKERNKSIPAVYLFIEKDGKFLISRRRNTGYQDGNYQVPSGHVEAGELPSQALVREAKEEIGINLSIHDCELVHVPYRPKHDNTDNRVDFFFKTKKWSGDIKNLEPDKCDDLKWVSYKEIPITMMPHVRDAIESVQRGIFYKELGMDFLKKNGLCVI